ncbi:hypothetical protein [Marimonas arenosa]|uniref:Lipoprotein n=1 Tax=Marimonas arenosa TaxID=1795305 RepID=A0AAE4B2A2_9RHOB|nr:hypothetical protein [Marimonas arenosa]MDQ2088833.1 hypothetical protein [Marimonas arenosa]
MCAKRLSDLRISSLFRAAVITLSGFLAACDAPHKATPAEPDSSPVVTSAYFAEDPAILIDAARSACRNPGETFVQPRPGVTQCRLLLNPEATAAVILQFDGAIRDLPQLVVSMASARAGDGFVVTGCAFLRVPRKDGSVARIAPVDRAVETKLNDMLRAVGGKPVREVPADVTDRCFSL